MSVTVEISNVQRLKTLRDILGVEENSKAIELSIERTIREYESAQIAGKNEHLENDFGNDLPDEYWDDLFSEPMLPNNAGSQAVIDERNEARF